EPSWWGASLGCGNGDGRLNEGVDLAGQPVVQAEMDGAHDSAAIDDEAGGDAVRHGVARDHEEVRIPKDREFRAVLLGDGDDLLLGDVLGVVHADRDDGEVAAVPLDERLVLGEGPLAGL